MDYSTESECQCTKHHRYVRKWLHSNKGQKLKQDSAQLELNDKSPHRKVGTKYTATMYIPEWIHSTECRRLMHDATWQKLDHNPRHQEDVKIWVVEREIEEDCSSFEVDPS